MVSSSHKIFFSIIIPTIKSPLNLKKLIKEILDQNKGNFKYEIIIVVQGEKKNIRFPKQLKRFKVIYSQKKGLSLAKNIGIKKSKGDYLIFLDDDVSIKNNFLVKIKKIIDRKPECSLIFGNILINNTKKNFKKIFFIREKFINIFNFENCLASAMIMKKENKKYFDINFGLGAKFYSGEETDLVLRYLKNRAKILFTPEIKIFHPEIKDHDLEKFINYGKGNIILLKKHLRKNKIFLIFIILSVIKSIILILYSIFKVDVFYLKKNYFFLNGKIKSFFNDK